MMTGHDSNKYYDTFDRNIFQGYEPTCAIRSQQIILRDFGIQIPQDELTEFSLDKGWYTGNGTRLDAIGNILETCGVGVHCSFDNNVEDLLNELNQGHRVIVGVDARELYAEPGSAEWAFFNNLHSPDHALIVAGIRVDQDSPENNVVVLTDPGKGDAYIEYPLNHFVGAWGDSKFFMMATDEAAPYQYNEETHCMEYSNFATDFAIQDFPFNNDFSSINDFDESYFYESLFGMDVNEDDFDSFLDDSEADYLGNALETLEINPEEMSYTDESQECFE